MPYATLDNVRARIPYRQITSGSDPSEAEVQVWLDEAHAQLDSALQAVGLPAPYSSSAAVKILGAWICDYAEGRVRAAYAAAGGDGQNDDGQALLEQWRKLTDPGDGIIFRVPANIGALLGASSPVTASSRPTLRSYETSNRDGKSVSNGDFSPVFRKGESF